MAEKIIYEGTFLIADIMCYHGCGSSIYGLHDQIAYLKKQKLVPDDAQLIMDAEPQGLGVHRLLIQIESKTPAVTNRDAIQQHFKDQITDLGFPLVDETTGEDNDLSGWDNWLNITINLVAMGVIFAMSMLFTPSILLTVSMGSLSFITTAYTARHYLWACIQDLRNYRWTTMPATISLGWLVALSHTLYHSISMPLSGSMPMIFMSFMMPIMLIGLVNAMDELKRVIYNKSKQMRIQGIQSLFPQMAQLYTTYECTSEHAYKEITSTAELLAIKQLMNSSSEVPRNKSTLQQGMFILIKQGDCFPVDCQIISGSTLVDESLLTGEHQQEKKPMDKVHAGAINLSQAVVVYATADSYNSTINQLLFRSNRAKNKQASENNQFFSTIYASLIGVALVASVVIPAFGGFLTLPLLLQNITGILFAVCPCTIAIAHQLPELLSIYYRNTKGIKLSSDYLVQQNQALHTVVFDKTGTLTTGNSQIDSAKGITGGLWQRIYLLEKYYGADHPIAKAITTHYESQAPDASIFQEIEGIEIDPQKRGLSAKVQGKQIHIGNALYIQQARINLPIEDQLAVHEKLAQGYTPVFVAEDNAYKGYLLIKHEIRPGLLASLKRLKAEGKRLIMLTGDTLTSAVGFNQQNEALFDVDNIHASQTPSAKENFLDTLMSSHKEDPSGVWFIGDGLNDAPCARIVTEKGGVSCAMTPHDKAAFFTEISLNGTLDYLFVHQKINNFLENNILQNQALLIYNAVLFLGFIITFSFAGLAVPPLIPMVIMVSTTLLTLFNAYRVKCSVENAMDKNPGLLNQFLASDMSIAILVLAYSFMLGALLFASLTTGTAILPTFTSFGFTVAISLAGTLAGAFAMVCTACALHDTWVPVQESIDIEKNKKSLNTDTTRYRFYPVVTPAPQVHDTTDLVDEPIVARISVA